MFFMIQTRREKLLALKSAMKKEQEKTIEMKKHTDKTIEMRKHTNKTIEMRKHTNKTKMFLMIQTRREWEAQLGRIQIFSSSWKFGH